MSKDDTFKRIQKKVQKSFELKDEHQSIQNPERFRFIGTFQDGLAPALKEFSSTNALDNGLYGYIDTKGNEVIPFQYHNAKAFSEGLAAVAIFEKVISPQKEKPDDLFGALLGLFSQKSNLSPSNSGIKYGFINQTGATKIPFQFQDAKSFLNGQAEVKQNGEWFWINKEGKRV